MSKDASRVLQGVMLVGEELLRLSSTSLLATHLRTGPGVAAKAATTVVTALRSPSLASAVAGVSAPTPPPPPPPPSAKPSRPPPLHVPNPERPTKQFQQKKVPAGPMARAFGFGGMAANVLVSTAGSALSRAVGGSDGSASALLTEANANILADGLCRMRGAGMKIGQMLSMADESVLPPAILDALKRVRDQADVMLQSQLEDVLREELGDDWRSLFAEFSEEPMAAASIGQVHRAVTHDGREVAVKVQYPGVAESIDSDLLNLKRLITVADILPRGLFIDSIMEVAREELAQEVDYRIEAEKQREFGRLLADDEEIVVPDVVDDLSTRRVLTTTLFPGVPIDQVYGLPQEVRDHVARLLLKATLRELFEFMFLQSDPNSANFLYDAPSATMALIDFGAGKRFERDFMRDYVELVWASANKDVATIEEVSIRMGFLTGDESPDMMKAHLEAGLVVGEPFADDGVFDFKGSGIIQRVAKHGDTFASQRLTPPPKASYALHRRLSGCFMACIKLGAKIECRDLLVDYRDLFLAEDAKFRDGTL